jgi:hypothetical protein
MTNRFKDLPRIEGPNGLTVPKIELVTLDNPFFGQTGVQYIFEDVYGAINAVFSENTDPDNPVPLVVSSEEMPQVVLSQKSKMEGPNLRGDSRVTYQYSLDATQNDSSFNLLALKLVAHSLGSKDGEPIELRPHRQASADSDPWGLTRGFNISANHMTFFGPEYPSNIQIKRFHDRSVAVLRLLGIANPELEDESDDISDIPIRYR